MKKFLFTFLMLQGISCTIFAQASGNYNTQQEQNFRGNYIAPKTLPQSDLEFSGANIIEFDLKALLNQTADSYTAIFNLTQLGKTPDETNNLINSRLNGFLGELKSIGIPGTDIYVDMVNFLPKYEYDVEKKLFSKKTYTEIPVGFELQKNVHIRYTKPELLDQIVSAAARQEIYDIVKVDYFVKDAQTTWNQLRAATFQYLAQISAQYEKAGISMDSAYTIAIENSWVTYPANRYENYRAFTSQRLDNNEKASSVINNLNKSVSSFYNALPSNDYDIVINPEILEPAVQFSYQVKVRYTLPERLPSTKTIVKKEFVLVSPNGEVKTLKIE